MGRTGASLRSAPGALVSALSLVLCLAGCTEHPDVVLYVSADEHVAREVVGLFEEQTGLRVGMVGDTEQTKTAGLVNRLRAERDHPQADVLWSSEVFMTIRLAEEGVLESYSSAATAGRPAAFSDHAGRWHGFGARARVICYAPDRVAVEDVPATWMELTRPRWRGRVVMADPRFGTTGGHLGAMKAYWSDIPAYYEAFLMGLADNDTRILPSGNAGVVQAVVSGEADLGMTDTDDVWAAQARGLGVDLVYARHDVEGVRGGGTLLIPNTVARVAGGPNPEAAAALIDFLLSEQVERMLAESVSHNVPVRESLAGEFTRWAVPDPLRVDLGRAAAARREAIDEALRHLDAPDAS